MQLYLEKPSKRVSCGKRYKIEKKVKEHSRKLKKNEKKKGDLNFVNFGFNEIKNYKKSYLNWVI